MTTEQEQKLINNIDIITSNYQNYLNNTYNKQEVESKLNAKLNISDFNVIKNAVNMHLNQKSFASNGYTKLPNGLILQWISTVMQSGSRIALPIAFPNANCISLATDKGTACKPMAVVKVGKTHIEVRGLDCSQISVDIFAIGY